MSNFQNLLNNKFVKFNETVLQHKLAQAKKDIKDDIDDALIAEAAGHVTEIRAVLELFELARENELKFKASITGVQLIEMVTGKTWKEMTAPSLGERASQVAGDWINRSLGLISRTASVVAEKTKRV